MASVATLALLALAGACLFAAGMGDTEGTVSFKNGFPLYQLSYPKNQELNLHCYLA